MSFKRTVNSPRGYDLAGTGRSTQLNSIYVGFVKQVDDKQRMGRLKVWIPELSGEPTDSGTWFTCNYASPFAGATNVYDNTNGNTWDASQQSYGFWFVPPDLENEVLVCFINGDPGRGIWFGCLFQQNMNNMVPGIPGNNSQPGLPVSEYNKNIDSNVNIENPNRPVFSPLADQLKLQGLDQDTVRGISSSGARRDNPINSSYGILTPGGTQIVLDDNLENRFIRLRTRLGAQILINDSVGSIYMNSRDGKNWVEMSAGGAIDVFAEDDISLRTNGSFNLRADLDINIEAGRNISISSSNDAPAQASNTLSTPLNGIIKINTPVDININSGNLYTTSTYEHSITGNNVYVNSNNNVYVDSSRDIILGAVTDLSFYAGKNNPPGEEGRIWYASKDSKNNDQDTPPTVLGTIAATPTVITQKDNQVQPDGSFKFITRNTILYHMPYHEPFDGHAANIPGTNTHVTQNTGAAADPYSGAIIPLGSIVPNQITPLNLIGTPKAGMQPGIYIGMGYDTNNNPLYAFNGSSSLLQSSGSYQISNNGIQFIVSYEGITNMVYQDVAGLKQIGIGHLLTPTEIAGNFVTVGQTNIPLTTALSDIQCYTLLNQDLIMKQQTVRNSVTVNITQNQFDALVSLCFNIGDSSFKSSSLVKNINAGNFDLATNGFLSWIVVNGSNSPGLLNRRRAEAGNFRGFVTAIQ